VRIWKRQNYLLWISLGTTVMMLAMGLLLANQFVQKRAIQQSARQRVDSVTNLAFYSERELLRLQREVAVGLLRPEGPDRDKLGLRYDIFLSGITWLRDSPSMLVLAERPQYAGVLPKLDRLLKTADAVFARPELVAEELRALLVQLDAMQIDLMALSSAASSVESIQYETLAEKMLQQSDLILGLALLQMVLLLVASVALYARQRRQLAEQQAVVHMNEALRLQRVKAEAANQAKSQFLANMSHELRTPFNGILGMIKILQASGLNGQQLDYTAKMGRATESLLALINDILDFSKVESGKLQVHNQAFALDHLLRDVSEILSAGGGSALVDVVYDIDPRLPAVLMGDALKLQQVLINLGSNAIKFTPQGFVVIALSLQDGAAPEDSLRVGFAVRDSGIGIAPENQAHIFSGFSQAEASTTRQYGGTGLGLAISKRLVELMGGQLLLDSALGQGSTFSFVLTVPVVSNPPPEWLLDAAAPSDVRRVLVVDDSAVGAQALARMTRAWHWPTDVAESGAAALACMQASAAQQQPYQLIFIDSHMPGMDAWDLVRQLRQLVLPAGLAAPTLVMVSGTGRDQLTQHSEQEQGLLDGMLTRPFTAAQMYEAALSPQGNTSRLRQCARVQTVGGRLPGMRILVVEDNLLNQQVAQELLQMEGAQVTIASNGQLGVQAVAAAQPPFDVVLMDLQMPVLDGYGATHAIRQTQDQNQLPIIAMTANAMASDRAACLAAGMNEHIGKPFDMGRLVSLLIRSTGAKALPLITACAPETGPTVPPDADSPYAITVAGLDVHGALQRMAGVRALYVRAARSFSASLEPLPAALSAARAAGDDTALRMHLHTLKGNAATLGATALSQAAAALETLCKSGGVDDSHWDTSLQALEQLAQAARCQLQQATAALDSGAAPAADPARATGSDADAQWPAVLAVLVQLRALLRSDDLDALSHFAEHRALLERVPGDFCDRLDAALQDLELEQALVLCEAQLSPAARPGAPP
jgi:two-component system, sensor histidine kinase and response regulator